MARHETDGNIITDKATGLQWVKNPRLILPGFTGSLGVSQGFWSPTAGTYTARNLVMVSSSQQFARGQAMAEGAVYLHAFDEYLGGGDSTWYKCLQGYTPNARQPGVDAGWASYWAAVDFFEGQENITYSAGNLRVSWMDFNLYICISGYTTGENPDDPSVDTTHWASAMSSVVEWEEDHEWSVNDVVGSEFGSFYWCTTAHTGTYRRPGTAAAEGYWQVFAKGYGPITITNPQWNWYTNDPRYLPLYLYCKQTHTAASDKGPGNATYWGVYDPFWWVVCPPDWYNLVPPGWNAYNAMDGGESFWALFGHNATLDAMNALVYEGNDDWRMPNALEALTRVSFETWTLFDDHQDEGVVNPTAVISTMGPEQATQRLVVSGNGSAMPYYDAMLYNPPYGVQATFGIPYPVRGGVLPQ